MSDKLTPDEHELLNAYLDGELSATERRGVELQLEQRPELRAALAELEALRDLFRKLPAQSLPGPFVDRVLSTAERTMLLGRQPATAAPLQPKLRNMFGPRAWLVTALAATVVAMLIVPSWYQERRLAQAPRGKAADDMSEAANDKLSKDAMPSRKDELPSSDADAPQPAASMRLAGRANDVESAGQASAKLSNRQPEAFANKITIQDMERSEQHARTDAGRAGLAIPPNSQPGESPADNVAEGASVDSLQAKKELATTDAVFVEVVLNSPPNGRPPLVMMDRRGPTTPVPGRREGGKVEPLAVQGPERENELGEASSAESDVTPLAAETHDSLGTSPIVAVETSVEQAGEILSDLIRSGATLRDRELTPEFSRQLAEQFRGNQKQISNPLDPSTQRGDERGFRGSSAQLQVENIVRAWTRLAKHPEGQIRSDMVIISPDPAVEMPSSLDEISQQAEPPQASSLRNPILSTAVQAAEVRRQSRSAEMPREFQGEEVTPAVTEAGQKTAVDLQIRLYLWVRELPEDPTDGRVPER